MKLSVSNLLSGHSVLIIIFMLTPLFALNWVSESGKEALEKNNTLYEGVLLQLDDIDVALKNARFHAYAGFMHDKALSVSKYHAHPYQLHVDSVENEFEVAGRAWKQILAKLGKESRYFENINALKKQYDSYMNAGALPALEAMNTKKWENIVSYTTGAIPEYAAFSESIAILQDEILNEALNEYRASQANIDALNQGLMIIYGAIVVCYALFSFWLKRRIIKPLDSVLKVLKKISGGDLTPNPEAKSLRKDEFGLLVEQIDDMRNQLSIVIEKISTEAIQVAELSKRLNDSQSSIERSACSQEGVITNAASALEEMLVSIESISQNAIGTSEKAKEAEKAVVDSSETIAESEKNVDAVSMSLAKNSNQILSLSEKIQRVSAVTDVIQNVAEKTNLLALNAAIEAARAGEQGRGFAVVADEVRNLAETTSKSVDEIETVISDIREEVSLAVASVEDTCKTADKVVAATNQTKCSIDLINDSATTVQVLVSEISESLTEQRSASIELSSNVEEVAGHAKENSKMVRDGVAVANELAEVSNQLKGFVSDFKW